MSGKHPLHQVIEVHELRSASSYDAIAGTVAAADKFLAYHHLTSEEAQRRLLTAADDELGKYKDAAKSPGASRQWLVKSSTVLTAGAALGLLAFFIYEQITHSIYQWRATSALVESALLAGLLALNLWLFERETRLTAMEMSMRIKGVVEQLRTFGMSRRSDLKLPTSIPTVCLSRVVRDQSIFTLPFNLIVTDDIVQLAYGDTAPCKVRYVNSHLDSVPGSEEREYVLQKGQVFRPSLFTSPPDPTIMRRAALNEGQFHFRAMETPLVDTLQKALNTKRPKTVIMKQFSVLIDYYFTRFLLGVLGVALVVNAVRYGTLGTSDQEKRRQGLEFLVVLQVYAILPILPLVLPTFFIIIRSYGNAQIMSLFDALQTSKTEFEDREDIDEFDAAPPPTKDLVLDWGLVRKRFWDQFVNVDVSFLARTTGLVTSLASATVICAIDREGTISLPTPTPEQLFVFDDEGSPVLLDLAEDTTDQVIRFQERDWEQYIASLKPIGLNLLLNTDCGATQGRIRLEHHRKANGQQMHGHIKPGRQACLCQIGKQIGFSAEVLRTFQAQKTIHAFAPYHQTTAHVAEYHFEVPSFVSKIYKETATSSYQLFTEGNVDLITESCSDYWTGKGLDPMDDTVEKKVLDYYQNAVINDGQVVAYAYRPVQNPRLLPLLREDGKPPTAVPDSVYLECGADNSNVGSAEGVPRISSASSASIPLETLGEHSPVVDKGKHKHRKRLMTNMERLRSSQGIEEKQLWSDVTKGQIFLGMALLSYQPKANVINFIEDLGLGGIRFVYFSSAPERESKAYAERLGLEIDWNSCIILSSDSGESPGYLEIHDMKAKLPRGVDKIRDHIRDVDDVPLHVSLFAECDPPSISEMVRIFQEHGEVVCCLGSTLNEMNVECFALADISIGIDPLSVLKSRNQPATGPISSLNLGASFTASPCAFSLHSDTSIYSLGQIIRDARTLVEGGRQAISFCMAGATALSLMMIVADCLLLPPIFTGYQILWVTTILLPPLAFSFLFSPYDPHVMTNMPGKNMDHLKDKLRFVRYFCARFSGVILVCVLVFAVSLEYLTDRGDNSPIVFGYYKNKSWTTLDSRDQWALLYAQNCALFVCVFLLVIVSSTFLHRTGNLLTNPPYHNRIWIGVSLLCIVVQIVFCTISLVPSPHKKPTVDAPVSISLSALPWWLWVIAFVAAPVVLLPVQEWVKVYDRAEWERFQKRSKLEFNTKLGMHSPL